MKIRHVIPLGLASIALAFPAFAESSVPLNEHSSSPLNQFALMFGELTNASSPFLQQLNSQYMGWGLTYARRIFPQVLMSGDLAKDSISLEGGAFLYRIGSLIEPLDETLVIPVSITTRYGVRFGRIFEPYIYGGVLKNFAIAQSRDSSGAQAALSALQPAFGAGLAVQFKGFIARAQYGYDMVGGGIGYQF